MKGCLSLLLAALLLLGCAALAETYVPGERSAQIAEEAFAAGHVVTADASLLLDVDPAAFDGYEEEEKAAISALLDLLEKAHLSVGAGVIEGGVRLELALYAQDGETSEGVRGAINATWDELSVESDLIPGQRVTAGWDTLLTAAGVDAQTADALVRMSPDEILEKAQARAGALAEQAAELAQPYLDILAQGLAQAQASEAYAPQIEGFDVGATVYSVRLTAQTLAETCGALVDRFEQDTALHEAMGLSGERLTDAVAQLRDAVSQITAEPFDIVLSFAQTQDRMLVSACVDGGSESAVLSAVVTAASGEPVKIDIALRGADADDKELGSMLYQIAVTPKEDPVIAQAADITATLSATAEGRKVCEGDVAATVAGEMQDGLPAMTAHVEENIRTTDGDLTEDPLEAKAAAIAEGKVWGYQITRYGKKDGDLVTGFETAEGAAQAAKIAVRSIPGGGYSTRYVMLSEKEKQELAARETAGDGALSMQHRLDLRRGLTAEGGESTSVSGELSVGLPDGTAFAGVYAGESALRQEDGCLAGEGVFTFGVPEMMIERAGIKARFSSAPYDPAETAGLEEIRVEELTDERVQALAQQIVGELTAKIDSLSALLPPELSVVIGD